MQRTGAARVRRSIALLALCALAGACSADGADGIRATDATVTIRPRGDLPRDAITGFRSTLFGVGGAASGPGRLVRSTDGARWTPVPLPGTDGVKMQYSVPTVRSTPTGLLTITGRAVEDRTLAGGVSMAVPAGAIRAWTTADGRRWTASPSITGTFPFELPNVQDVDDVLLLGASSGDGRFQLLRREGSGPWTTTTVAAIEAPSGTSATLGAAWVEQGAVLGYVSFGGVNVPPPMLMRSEDRGRSWTAGACEQTPDGPCGGYGTSFPGLLVRGGRSSTDQGATWSGLRFEPAPAPDCTPRLTSVVRVHGGWVAVGDAALAGGPSYDSLLWSSDGARWTFTHGDGCTTPAGADGGTRTTGITAFRGDLWAATASWPQEGEDVGRAQALRSADGRTWSAVDEPHLAAAVPGTPLVVGGLLLVPQFDPQGPLTTLRGSEGG